MRTAAQVRDLLLIAITGVYALGFGLWSVYAWRQGLGSLPIANTQYFIAGFPILAVLFLVYSIFKSRRWLESWASVNVRRRRSIVWLTLATMLAFVILETLVAPIARTRWSVLSWEVFANFKLLVFIMFLILVAVVWNLGLGGSDPATNWITRFVVVPLSAVLIGLGSIWLIDETYARLPQEFGGFSPRRAILHLRNQELPSSLREILLPDAAPTGESIADSIQVFIFYADRDRLIIKITCDPQKDTLDQLRSMPAHEIRSDVVVATTYLR